MESLLSKEHAEELDKKDPLRHLRAEFIFPSKADLKSKTLNTAYGQDEENEKDECIYLCGNSLGLQPRRTSERINEHLTTWANKGVLGHFFEHEGSKLPPFLHVDEAAAVMMAPIVGASKSEVAAMETLTANLHLLMCSFYRPTKDKFKIILEGKAFPSDHYAVHSQILSHGFDPADAMITIEPVAPAATLTTSQVLCVIDEHASTTALILLPGIQYYSGQFFDVKTITAHAHSKGLVIGWDLAHAVGNVELQLHDWDVDFAAWCTYKYMNAGPGAIAGLYVHERHGTVNHQALEEGKDDDAYRPRLSGWWGGDKTIRFEMGRKFVPIPGAGGYQVGNPSALALTGLMASLEIFAETSMKAIRTKSLLMTDFLEQLLERPILEGAENPYWIISPKDPAQRGAQLSIQLELGMIDNVLEGLLDSGVVIDERKPDVIRVAPAPLYNSFVDVWSFGEIFRAVCARGKAATVSNRGLL